LHDGDVATVAARLEVSGGHGTLAVMEAVRELDFGGHESFSKTTAYGRADHLFLVMGEERIEVVGPVSIVVGSRELQSRPASKPGVDPSSVDHRWLDAGDAVLASGLFQRGAAESSGAYRDRPIRWRIVPAAEGAKVKIAFAGIPRSPTLRP